jgi:hypothetical protein
MKAPISRCTDEDGVDTVAQEQAAKISNAGYHGPHQQQPKGLQVNPDDDPYKVPSTPTDITVPEAQSPSPATTGTRLMAANEIDLDMTHLDTPHPTHTHTTPNPYDLYTL